MEFYVKGDAFATDIPLIVIIDKITYSAGDTAAAIVSEMGRGHTIGSQSYGKGIFHATIPLRDEVMLQMTIAKWLSANGEWYHGVGVPAEIDVLEDPATDTDEILEKAINVLVSGEKLILNNCILGVAIRH